LATGWPEAENLSQKLSKWKKNQRQGVEMAMLL
jgi:hypothetical protein